MTKRLSTIVFTLLFTMLLVVPVFANAEAGPDFTVMILSAPDDTIITLITPNGVELELRPLKRGWESCFRLDYTRLYDAMYPDTLYNSERMRKTENIVPDSVLRIESAVDGLSAIVPMPEDNQILYNHLAVLTLNGENGVSMANSTYMPLRNVILVLIRVSVTLIAEGVILYLLGYRSRRSWIIFLTVNLVTQTFLNVTVTGNYLAIGYWELGFMVLETLIFLTEGIAFALLLKEHKSIRGFITAVLANTVSLLCGWFLLVNLPL